MFDVLRFKADVKAARVRAAVGLTPARRVALVFPEGQPVAMARPLTLQALADHARKAGKHLAIVGGDAQLRACAVAAGLAAATSLDEWRRARDRVASRPVAATTSARPAGLTLVAEPRDARVAPSQDEPGDGTAWEVEPPDYVARLTAAAHGEEHQRGSDVPADVPALRRRRPPSVRTDAETYAAIERTSELGEEAISDTILATGHDGLDAGLAH